MAKHENKIVIYAALAGNTAIAIMKIMAAMYTGSSAMLSDLVIRETEPNAAGVFGMGVSFIEGASGTLRRALITRSRRAGMPPPLARGCRRWGAAP